jgi:hypothetical protein
VKLTLLPRAGRRILFFLKAKPTGPGSRGGKVLGYTKRGRAIYEDSGASPERHAGFELPDHGDAATMHRDVARDRWKTPEQMAHHNKMADYHVGEYNRENRRHLAEHAPTPEHLPEDHHSYFQHTPTTQHVPLGKFRPEPEHPGNLDKTKRYMGLARSGAIPKRAPIKAVANEDGSYSVGSKGHHTFHVAKEQGWRSLPVEIEKAGFEKAAGG